MTSDQETHLASIKFEFTQLVDTKYRKGQEEHGGDLFRIGINKLLDAAIDEAIDQVVYLLTMRSELKKISQDPTSQTGRG